MADVITRLKVESQEYDSKLKNAVSQMAAMEQQVRRTGATFAYADKEEKAFAQSLGNLDTAAKSAKERLTEYTDAINSLTATYRQMTEEERSSDFGKALASSIDQLKGKAAELKDVMNDTTAELRNLSSDTSFTQGVSMMTRTIGACAAAVTAWTGNSKEMDKVMKDLAKIGTTTIAVEQLTKAFQKQNLVMMKNPYVAAAAAVVALGLAIGKLNQKLNEQTEEEKKRAKASDEARQKEEERAKKMAASASKMISSYQALKVEWQSLSTQQEKNEWIKNNQNAFRDLGLAVNSVTDAENAFVNNTSAMIKSFQLRAEASAYQSMSEDAYARYIQEADKVRRNMVRAGDEVKGQVTYREGEGLYTYNPTTGGYRYTAEGAKKYNMELAESAGLLDLKKEAERYVNNYVKLTQQADQILSSVNGKTVGTSTTSSYKAVKASGTGFTWNDPNGMPEAGSVDYLEWQAATVRNSMGGATNNEEYEEMKAHLNEILAKIREIKGEKEVAFEPGSLNDLNQQLREAQETLANLAPDTEAWAAALQNVADKQAAVNALTARMGGNTAAKEQASDARQMGNAFSAAANIIGEVGGALNKIEDPSAKIAGLVAQAIASVAAGLGEMLAQPAATSEAWGWVALAISGTATMLSTIAAIRSATSSGDFAEGGIIPGSSYSGDRLTANVNSGELILNRAQQNNIAAQLSGMSPLSGLQLGCRVSGTDLMFVLDSANRSHGGSRGYYIKQH